MEKTFRHIDSFERVLAVATEEIELLLHGFGEAPWSDFWLNPRRLRGSDFLMRWSQGVWSEHRLRQATDKTGSHFALPYGPSGTAPSNSVREFELYFERLDAAGLGGLKRPDLLIFPNQWHDQVKVILDKLGGESELPFLPEDHPLIQELLDFSVLAVECENSLWVARMMPQFDVPLRPQKRLGKQQGLPKNAVLPTVILKEEDRVPLLQWQAKHRLPIHLWHVFFDLAFGLPLDEAQRLIDSGLILPTVQTFQAPGGATTKKAIFKVYHHYAYPLGTTQSEPTLRADHIQDKNGHILPYVHFEGGDLLLSKEAHAILESLPLRSR